MFLSKYKFFSCKFYCSYTVRTCVLRKNKKLLQKNSNLGLFRGENSIFSGLTFSGGLNRIKPVGFNRTRLFMQEYKPTSKNAQNKTTSGFVYPKYCISYRKIYI